MARTARRRFAVAAVLTALTVSSVPIAPAGATDPPPVDPSAGWLDTVNSFRAMAHLPPVVADPALSAGAVKHSCYMLQNGITHTETVGAAGYTTSGAKAGKHGNVAVSELFNTPARGHIELWMTGPFHAIGILRPGLRSVGFGVCNQTDAPTEWRSAATLNVLDGLGPEVARPDAVLFPGDGATTNLNTFIIETPNPLDFCSFVPAPTKDRLAGLPVIAMMPTSFSGTPTATMTGPDGPLDTCVLGPQNTTGDAQTLLSREHGVVVIPRDVLSPGTYSVTVTTTVRTVSWSFTVDPNATHGEPAEQPVQPVQPVSVTTPLGGNSMLHVLDPTRIVDTRTDLGSTSLVGTLVKRIQITGRGGVPNGAQAISANFTVTNPVRAGYLTIWNCSLERPTVSTLNYAVGESVPNGASVPLDSTGGLCVSSEASADLLIDVNAYYGTTDGGRFAPVEPARLMDSRIGLGVNGRLAAGSVTSLHVNGVAGVPADADAVTLNVTSVDPSVAGYVTVYPCGTERPVVSSLNPVPGTARPNVVITPVGDDGTICLYTLTDVDLVVDITGYVMADAALEFTPTAPFRFTDTRDRSRPDVNAGLAGEPLAAGSTVRIQVAGRRNIAADAQAISANFTVTGATSAGYVTAWPCGPRPTTSTVNFVVGTAVANGAQMPLSDTGELCIYASNAVHVIVDINGWWS